MRLVVQRVTSASVDVDGRRISQIDKGLVVLVGIGDGDTEDQVRAAAKKVASLRIFADEAGKMNLSIVDAGGEALVVSQFTLYGDTSRGNRPSFTDAARPEVAKPLADLFAEELRANAVDTKEGVFGANMQVSLVNSGPVTIII